ncbi:hypothetical protein KL911_001020 [Ogataea haglerorum]|uniref:uncharacterized protein n=1 Tax=Ogataea haglerorum TaxID=1937702 RepID=UPI001C8A6057|nr:uncharacterized protein KL911_001020 [Ogataea haglerorum]KAG7758044.1 hypothetical protein KL911_001020 [Ogataea haglerorum]
MKQCGILRLASGIRVGYVSGKLDDIESDLEKVFADQLLDILITYQWPTSIAKEETLSLVGDSRLNDLLEWTRPRYWFCVGSESGKFFERLPFKWDNDRVTRFISLGQQGTQDKWYYAFNLNLDPLMDKEGVSKFGEKPQIRQLEAPVETESRKRKFEGSEVRTKRETKKVAPENCFFCVSNAKAELHMIISIADCSYMTVAKGPLTTRDRLGFSGHGLIIPIGHYPTFSKYRDAEEPDKKVEETKLFKEVAQYQKSVVSMFSSLGDYKVVFWEISRANAIHHHIQFVPLEAKLEEHFETQMKKQIAYNQKMYGSTLVYTKDMENEKLSHLINNGDYMQIRIVGPDSETRYVFELVEDNIDLQFPRRVLAFLMKLGRRVIWDKCRETLLEEASQKDAFREKYQPFDFSKEKNNINN